jgi:undecaprenyl-diphosphatase
MNVFDEKLLFWLNGLAGRYDALDALMRVLASDYLVPLLGVLSIVGLWYAGRTPAERERFQVTLLIGAASVGLANLAVVLLNRVWDRTRPFAVMPDQVNLMFYPSTDPSFPANPAAVTFAAATSVALASPRLGAVLALAAAGQALARVYAGVFYPTDVLAGAAVGVAIVGVPLALRHLLRPLPELVIRVGRALMLA